MWRRIRADSVPFARRNTMASAPQGAFSPSGRTAGWPRSGEVGCLSFARLRRYAASRNAARFRFARSRLSRARSARCSTSPIRCRFPASTASPTMRSKPSAPRARNCRRSHYFGRNPEFLVRLACRRNDWRSVRFRKLLWNSGFSVDFDRKRAFSRIESAQKQL